MVNALLLLALLACYAVTLGLQIASQALPSYFKATSFEETIEFGLWKLCYVPGRDDCTSLTNAATLIRCAQAGAIISILSGVASGALTLLLLFQGSHTPSQSTSTRLIRWRSFASPLSFMLLSGVSMGMSLMFFLIDIDDVLGDPGTSMGVAFTLACVSVAACAATAVFLWNFGSWQQANATGPRYTSVIAS